MEDINRLHEEKINLTKRLELVQSEMENHSCINGVSDDSTQEIITRLEKENKELHEELNKYNKNSGVYRNKISTNLNSSNKYSWTKNNSLLKEILKLPLVFLKY